MKKILVADDEEILRMLICDTLEDLGFEIDEAEDGLDALNKINQQPYDLVILDYMMPNLTGLEVIERIPAQVKENTPILMLTAKAQESDRQIALEKGANFFVSKPFSPIELLSLVEELLDV
ncbi:response regulator [Solibacillus sp. MA9]|uniref:Response regulator n=1 Tax=Solibacillus palustris TaxID=2908203 RepID=A0ABS9UAM9_9BACL|nr:response regulator [Solibacillus sp. MA9]MCH7321180.1 response regulator [Solibacillus sp. MA9]